MLPLIIEVIGWSRSAAHCLVRHAALQRTQNKQLYISLQHALRVHLKRRACQVHSFGITSRYHSSLENLTSAEMGTVLYQPGDVVDVKKHGRARVVEGPMQDEASPFHGRYRFGEWLLAC